MSLEQTFFDLQPINFISQLQEDIEESNNPLFMAVAQHHLSQNTGLIHSLRDDTEVPFLEDNFEKTVCRKTMIFVPLER